MERRVAVLLLVLTSSGCALLRSSDRTFWSDAAAEHIYQEARYDARCAVVVGPDDCAAFSAEVDALRDDLQLADRVMVKGRIPTEERKVIRKRLRAIRKHK